jgi:cupin 2 domain-containing protein
MSEDFVKGGDLFAAVPARLDNEEASVLAELPGARIERIVSTGQASPPGFWYDQDWTEWFVVLSGSAGLRIEGEAGARVLAPGSWLEIPPHIRHRIDWTDADEPTVWLALHARCEKA